MRKHSFSGFVVFPHSVLCRSIVRDLDPTNELTFLRVKSLKYEVNFLEYELNSLKYEVNFLNYEVNFLKYEVSSLKYEITVLKYKVVSLRGDLFEILRYI